MAGYRLPAEIGPVSEDLEDVFEDLGDGPPALRRNAEWVCRTGRLRYRGAWLRRAR
jgi:hypothetical protein